MRCHNCGTDNSDDDTICAVCGRRVIERRFRDWLHWRMLSPEERKVVSMCIAACCVLLIAIVFSLLIIL